MWKHCTMLPRPGNAGRLNSSMLSTRVWLQFVYDNNNFDGDDVIPVNIGDEATRFTFHIIRHYHELPSVVVFTQVCMAFSMCHHATLTASAWLRAA
jgi:hypothetical protein